MPRVTAATRSVAQRFLQRVRFQGSFPTTPPGAPTLIGSLTSNVSATSKVVTLVGDGPSANGVVFVAATRGNDATAVASSGITSITDSRGNTWVVVEAISRTGASPAYWTEVWITAEDVGRLRVGDTVTINYGASMADHAISVWAKENVDTTGAIPGVDAHNSGNFGIATSVSVAVPSAGSLGASNDVIIAVLGQGSQDRNKGGAAITWPSNYTPIYDLADNDTGAATNSIRVLLAYRQLVNTTTQQTVNPSWTPTLNGALAVFALKSNTVVAPVNQVVPTAYGPPQVGITVTSDDGTWANTPTGFTYQWQRADDAAFTTNVADIGAATTSSYTLAAADLGKFVRLQVTASNAAGSSSATSNVIGTNLTGTGIQDSTSEVVRIVYANSFTDAHTHTLTLTDAIYAGDTVSIWASYSTNNNFANSYTDDGGNTYAQDAIVQSATNGALTEDVWSSLNVTHQVKTGQSILHTADGTPVGNPTDSPWFAIFAITPPSGKTLAKTDSPVYSGGNSSSPPLTSAALTTTVATTLLFYGIGVQQKNSGWADPGSGYKELVDEGNAVNDPPKGLAVQYKAVSATQSAVTTSMGLTLGGTASWSSVFLPYAIAGGTTPVSQTAALVIEATQGIAQTSGQGVDETQGVATTSSDPVEAAKGIAATALGPVDELGGVATTTSDPVDAAGGVASTSSDPVDAAQGVAQTAAGPVDEAGGVASTGLVPLDAAGAVAQTALSPVEATRGIAATALEVLDALGGISASAADPVEAVQGIAQTGVLPLTALQGVAATGELPVEALGVAITPVSQTAVITIESLGAVSSTGAAVLEALGAIAAAVGQPVETLARLQPVAVVPIEATARVPATVVVVPIESALGVAAIAVFNLDEDGFTFTIAFVPGRPTRGWVTSPPESNWSPGAAITDGWDAGPPEQ